MSKPCLIKDTKHSNGYSTVKWEGRTGLSHRKAYADANNLSRAALDGIVIRHTCDNRKCIEPTHLVPGTQGQNLVDRTLRHRYRKLTIQEAATIKLRLFIGETVASLSREYGVRGTMIHHIKTGRQWSHA